MKEKLVYTVPEVAKLLGVNVITAYELARRSDFPAIRVSPRRIVIPKQAFHKWLEEAAQKPNE